MNDYDFVDTEEEAENADHAILTAKLDAQQKKDLAMQDQKCAKEKAEIEKGVMMDGVFYKKVNGEWVYFGTSSAGITNPGWTFANGYWYYHGFAYTNYKGMWYRYYENSWHKFEKTLPKAPADPAGKYKIETPLKPDWKKVTAPPKSKTPTKATTPKMTVKKAPAPKLTPKENASAQSQIVQHYGK